MQVFIQVTDECFVRAEHISAVERDDEGYLSVFTLSGDTFYVAEEYEAKVLEYCGQQRATVSTFGGNGR